jgi:hypothetical protein
MIRRKVADGAMSTREFVDLPDQTPQFGPIPRYV